VIREVVATVAALSLALAANAAAADRDGYRGYVGLFGEPTHEASQGAGWTANFNESRPGSIDYKVCLKHRDDPEVKRCWRKSTGANGRSEIFVALYVNDVGGAGSWRAKWFVGGKKVEAWSFRVRSEGV
jgi:hypothetical protein